MANRAVSYPVDLNLNSTFSKEFPCN